MDSPHTRLLLTHGVIVFVLGLACGYGFWIQIMKKRSEAQIRPWRVAHATLLMVGLTMLVAGLLDPHLALTPPLRTLAGRLLIISGWSFSFALVGGALTGIRGLAPTPAGLNALLFAGHAIGAAGSSAGMGLIAYGLLLRR